MPDQPPTAFADLKRWFAARVLDRVAGDPGEDDPVAVVPLRGALATGEDPLDLLTCLRSLGLSVATLDDLARAVAALPAEEEICAFRCAEGVAVVIAPEARWVLFTDEDDRGAAGAAAP